MLLRSIIVTFSLMLGVSSASAQCSGNPAAGRFCGNPTAGATLPSWATGTAMLDRAFGTASGSVLNRNGSTWVDTQNPMLGVNGGTGGALILNGSTSGSATLGVRAAAGTATVFNLPPTNGSLGFGLITDGAGNTSWSSVGAGTVTSVGLALPGIFTVTNSPVTSTGTLTGTLNTQSANLVWAGPTTGAAATPTFRSLVGADLPNPSASTLGGIQSFAGTTSQWIRSISTSGVPASSQPAFTDISGVATGAQLPNPSATTLGGIESFAAVSHQWINQISTSGVPTATQPNFTDLVGNATLAQLPSIGNNSVLGNNSGGSAVPSALTASNILDMINNVQGDVLYRAAGGTGWAALAPGTSGQVLTTGGAAANPSWATVTGTGTVTNVATGTGLTGGAITTTGTISLAPITSLDVLANITGGSAAPIPNTMTAILDATLGSTQGNILYRGASVWQVLAPGTNGQVLTQGSSTPSWANAGTLTNVTIGAGTGINVTGTCNISTSGTCTVASIPLDPKAGRFVPLITGTVSGVACNTSSPFNCFQYCQYRGNQIIVNGVYATIPSGGCVGATGGIMSAVTNACIENASFVTTCAQTLAANTLYYVYVGSVSSTLTMIFSPNAYNVYTSSFGNAVMNGDATRSLIGLIQTQPSTINVAGSANQQNSASWYNPVWDGLTGTASGSIPSGSTWTNISTGVGGGLLTYVQFSDNVLTLTVACGILQTSGSATTPSIGIGVSTTSSFATLPSSVMQVSLPTNDAREAVVSSSGAIGFEGYVIDTIMGNANGAGTSITTSNCTIQAPSRMPS